MSTARDRLAVISVTQGEGHGAETVLEELLRAWPPGSPHLVAAAPRGSRVLAVADGRGMETVALETAADAFVPNARAILRARKALKGVRLVHAWSARAFEFAAWLARELHVPACGTQHDHPQAVFHAPVRRKIMQVAANRFDGLVCVSDAVADACRAAGYRCALRVIHNGVSDVPIERCAAPQVRIGFLGMYAAGKGFSTVAEWVRRLNRPDLQWRLYGDVADDLKPAAEKLARDYPRVVSLMGHHDREDIFGNVDILVHAAFEFEAFGMVLIEAAQAGLPVVASSLGGAPEIVVDGQTGFLFDPGDQNAGLARVAALADDPALRARLGRQARARYADHFGTERMAAGYREHWERAIACPGPC